jgi:hypothetical protein
VGSGQDGAEIKVMGQHDIIIGNHPRHNFRIRCIGFANR